MKALALILTTVIVFGMAMALIAKVDNTDKVYDPIQHLKAIKEGFSMIPSFEELKQFTQAKSFTAPVEQLWRFQPFVTYYVTEEGKREVLVVDGKIFVLPDSLMDQTWVGFEWFNQPLGYIVGVFIRANGITMWLTDWLVSFFGNVDVLFPSAGMVERSVT